MLNTQAEIEQSVRSNLPIIFGQTDSVDRETFQQKYNALVDYATAVSAPILGPETIRYQSMLLYISLLFLSLRMFRIPQVKIGDQPVSVDSRLLVIYAIFIGAIIVVFLTKAYVDYQRAHFVRTRNDQAVLELQVLLNVGLARRNIQNYFWFEIFDAIGRSYRAYSDATAAVLNKPPDSGQSISNQAFSLDRNALSKIPDTQAEIAKLDAYLSLLVLDLSADENRFQQEAVAIRSGARLESEDDLVLAHPRPYEKIRAAFDRSLRKWLDARSHLVDEHLHIQIEYLGKSPEVQQLQAMHPVLKRIGKIRRLYAALEIAMPVAFAVLAILYVQFR